MKLVFNLREDGSMILPRVNVASRTATGNFQHHNLHSSWADTSSRHILFKTTRKE
jgi:hypothetical protein